MTIPSDAFIVRYVQEYLVRFNKNKDFPGAVVEEWSNEDKGLFIQMFAPTTAKRISKIIPWDVVIKEGKELGINL